VCMSQYLSFYISRMHGHIFYETCQNYSLPGPHENIDICKVSGSKVKVCHRNLMNSIARKPLEGVESKWHRYSECELFRFSRS